MGFDGKTLIHPGQVDIANDVWAPTDDEVAHARRVIEAFDEARADGRGVVTVDGRMIENLHVDNARRTLAIAEAIARPASLAPVRRRLKRRSGHLLDIGHLCTIRGSGNGSPVGERRLARHEAPPTRRRGSLHFKTANRPADCGPTRSLSYPYSRTG